MGSWKKKVMPNICLRAKLNYTIISSAPSGQVEMIIYAKITLWKIQNKQQAASKEKESASRLARSRWGVEGYSQSQNVSGVRKTWYFLTLCNRLYKSDVLGERRRMSILKKVNLSSAEHWKLRCTLPNPPLPPSVAWPRIEPAMATPAYLLMCSIRA